MLWRREPLAASQRRKLLPDNTFHPTNVLKIFLSANQSHAGPFRALGGRVGGQSRQLWYRFDRQSRFMTKELSRIVFRRPFSTVPDLVRQQTEVPEDIGRGRRQYNGVHHVEHPTQSGQPGTGIFLFKISFHQ